MAQRHAEQLGKALGGTYLIERLLGQGGMGAVYAARHLRTGGLVAVKVLDPEATDAEIYRRFQNEARIVSALRHPHIVQVIDFDEDDDGTPFMVMELLEGEDLHRRLRRMGRLQLNQALELARQVGAALHAAHQLGVIHRDVKPQNVFLCRHQLGDEVREVAKVVDFGISKIRDVASQTQEKTVLGTPYYMSPEAARAQNADLDGRTDQWGLGVILYRALCGKLPFDNPDPLAVLYQVVNEQPAPLAEVAPELPRGVCEAVMRAMSKRREERFPTMTDFVRALELGAAEAGEDYVLEVEGTDEERTDRSPAPAPVPAPVLPQAAPRWRPVVLGVAAAVTAMLAATGVVLWQRGRLAEHGGSAPPSLSAVRPASPTPTAETIRPAPAIARQAPAPVATPVRDVAPPAPAPTPAPIVDQPPTGDEPRRPDPRAHKRRRSEEAERPERLDRGEGAFDRDF